MKLYESLVLLLGFLAQVLGTRITLDEKAQHACKREKKRCEMGKICALQHFDDWSNTVPMTVCIPLSFVPVRNMICQLPPERGTCFARYIRWYYDVRQQGCTHFQYSGCKGSQNNFMTKKDCEDSCLSSTSINLINDGSSSLVKVQQPPVFEPPTLSKHEALNSILIADNGKPYDIFPNVRYRPIRHRPVVETNRNKRRLHKERDKERRKRRERKKEKRRLRKLRQRNKRRKEKKNKKGKSRKKKTDEVVKEENETTGLEGTVDDQATSTEEVQKKITNEIAEKDEDEKTERERRKEKKRKKRRQRKKRRLGKEKKSKRSYSRYTELRGRPSAYSYKMFSILDRGRDYSEQVRHQS